MYIIAWANNLSAADITSRSESLGSQVFGDSLSAENKPIDVAIGSFKATCAYLDSDTRAKLNADSNVLWIEEDTEMEFDQEVLPGDIFYNLDLLDGRKDSIFDSTMLGRAGEGVDIYVVDSGVFTQHEDLKGRSTLLADLSGKATPQNQDGSGHGTHVAAIAAGTTTGVARKAEVIGIRLGDRTFARTATLQALQMVMQTQQQRKRPGVVNMSLGGGASNASDLAVRQLVQAGIPVVVSAGNKKSDACTQSPAREPSAITVAASDAKNQLATFSNFGSCVDITAPGVKIASAANDNPGALTFKSGTSMSAPLVTGVVAVMLSQGIPAAQIPEALRLNAQQSGTGDLRGSPNLFLSLPKKA